jgi:hypothetical protein
MKNSIETFNVLKTNGLMIAVLAVATFAAIENSAEAFQCNRCQSQSRSLSHFGSPATGPSLFGYPAGCSPQLSGATCNCQHSGFAQPSYVEQQYAPAQDIMDTRNFSLLDYRRMFVNGTTPSPAELAGRWRGVNKGIVELVGYRQFIKEITPQSCQLTGDNVMVEQVSADILRSCGWQVKSDPQSIDGIKRKGKFAIEEPRGIGAFKHGTIFNYRNGDNKKSDPVRLLVDKVVKIDDNHLLGRATANFGPVQIPLAYFVLERMEY